MIVSRVLENGSERRDNLRINILLYLQEFQYGKETVQTTTDI